MNMLQLVAKIEKVMLCNCDLDRWQPEKKTGHSFVCRIHKEAMRRSGECEVGNIEPDCSICGDTGIAGPSWENPDGEMCECVKNRKN